MLHLITGTDGITRHRYYRLKDQHLPELFKRAYTMLLLQGTNEIDIQVPLTHFTIYKDWLDCGSNRSNTFCKYGAITNYPYETQELMLEQILVVQHKGVKLVMSDTHITLTIMRYYHDLCIRF